MELSSSTPPSLPRLRGDPVALRRAVTNLVLNAVQHAGGRGVRVARQVDELHGGRRRQRPGIAPGELRRLVSPFERGDTAEARGAGLGLAINVALVDLHGGTLSAHSEVGRGSTFTAPAGGHGAHVSGLENLARVLRGGRRRADALVRGGSWRRRRSCPRRRRPRW
ncbi:MAG: ATP-binding protein [Polyangiales bacterium]